MFINKINSKKGFLSLEIVFLIAIVCIAIAIFLPPIMESFSNGIGTGMETLRQEIR